MPRRRRPLALSALASVVAATALGAGAPAASAGTQLTQNACKWSVDDLWRNLDITLTGAAAPNPVGGGATAVLGQTAAISRLPDFIAESGYNLGLLTKGKNTIPASIWGAFASSGGATQVVQATITVETTITVDSEQNFVSATPMDARVPLPDTSWTAPASGALSFTQAGPGTLPQLPIGRENAMRQPLGSAVIRAALSNDVRIVLDCQPGAQVPGGKSFNTATASPFESVPVVPVETAPGPQPTPTPTPAPTVPPIIVTPPPKPTVKSSSLKVRNKRRVSVQVSCAAGTGACFGRLEIKTVSKQKLGKTTAIRTLVRSSYSVGAGKTRTLDLPLTPDARSLFKRKSSVAVQVRMLPQETPTVAAATKQLTFRRR